MFRFLRNPGELKSIKNISMLRHQQQTSKPEAPPPQYEVDYENLSMLRPTQTSPVSLTTKNEAFEEYHDNMSMLRPTQTSPVSLTTKVESFSEGDYHESIFRGHGSPKKEEDYESMMTQNSPMSLTRNDRELGENKVKVEEEDEDEYEDTPTDLSMDTERHLMKEEDNK